MSKRVLSICLAVLIMLMAVPMSIFMPALAEDADEFVLETLNYPQQVTDVVMNDFTGLNDTDHIGSGKPVSGGGSYSYVDGKLVQTWTEAATNITTYLRFGSGMPTANTTAFSFHVDTTGMTHTESTLNARIQFYRKSGSSCIVRPGKTWYFLEDGATEATAVNTGSATVWNTYVEIPVGKSGTVIIPFDAMYDSAIDELTTDTGYSIDGTEYNINKLYSVGSASSFIGVQYRTNIAAESVIVYDDLKWLCDNPLAKYTTANTVEDFSDDSRATGGWGDFSPAATHSIKDGKFQLSIPAKETEESTVSGGYYTFQLKKICTWNKAAKAFAFDLDLSEIPQQTYIRTRFYDESDSANAFAPWGGTIYYYGEDGSLKAETLGTSGTAYATNTYPPVGFKGTVVIPVESMKNAKDQTQFSDTLYDQKDMTLEVEVRAISGNNAGQNIYLDNVDFYVEPVSPEVGTMFSSAQGTMAFDNLLTEDVKTIEFWHKGATGGPVISRLFSEGNASQYTTQFYVGINDAGNPVYNVADGKGAYANCVFDTVSVTNGEWNHVAFVKNGTSLSCYVNSALAGTFENVPETIILPSRLTVGCEIPVKSVTAVDYYGGTLAELRLWNTVRTAKDFFNDSVGTPADTTGLIAGYALAEDTADTYVGENDIVKYDYKITADNEKYAAYDEGAAEGEYSFVFIPDTQIVNCYYPDRLSDTYDWILENQEKYNIQAVMGLGDITDKNDDNDTIAGYGEWQRAKEQFDRLTEAGIPWTVVPGNHDVKNGSVSNKGDVTTGYANLNAAFPYEEISQMPHWGGGLNEGSIVNSYYYLTVGEVDYMLLCLDMEPSYTAINWAKQVVANNPDRRVIVTTHIYMNASAVRYDNNGMSGYTGYNNLGQQIWEEVLAPFENVDMILCGHVCAPGIISRTDKGVNGNNILQLLIDTQDVDYSLKPASAVAVATFSADGNDVRFRFYSTSQNAYLDEDSQVSFTLEGKEGAPIVENPAVEDYFADAQLLQNFDYLNTYASNNEYSGNYVTVGHGVSNSSQYMTLAENVSTANRQLNLIPADGLTSAGAASTRMSLSLKKLPVVTDASYNAIAFYFDASAYPSWKAPYLDCNFRQNSSGSNGTDAGTVWYLVDMEGNMTKHTQSGNWGFAFPSQFKGYVILPFENSFNGAERPAGYMVQESQTNNAIMQIEVCENQDNKYTFVFDNLCYLKNFDPDLTFSGANVSLGDNIEMNYAVDSTVAEKFDSVRVEFEQNGNVANVTDSTVNEAGQLVFNFAGTYDKDGNFVHITPKNLADTVKATYYGTKDGVESVAVTKTYSAADYCYDILAGDYSAEAKRVAADLLNFAAENQKYMNYKVDSLVNEKLDQSLATPDSEYTAPVSCTDTAYETVENPTVTWKGAGLNLKSAVSIRFKFTAENIENTAVKVEVGDETYVINSEYFEEIGDGQYYAYFNGLSAAQMREPVYVTVYSGGKAISNTLRYSVESYVKSKETSESLGALVKSLLKYGDATAKYAELLKEAQ